MLTFIVGAPYGVLSPRLLVMPSSICACSFRAAAFGRSRCVAKITIGARVVLLTYFQFFGAVIIIAAPPDGDAPQLAVGFLHVHVVLKHKRACFTTACT